MAEREKDTFKLVGLDRTYHFEIVEHGLSESSLRYLKIQEHLSEGEEDEVRRGPIYIYSEDIEEFVKTLNEAIKQLQLPRSE